MRDTGNYLKVIYSFSATIDKLRKSDITLDCGVINNTAAMSMMNVIDQLWKYWRVIGIKISLV